MAAAASKRARKRHVQQELFRRGGKRKGAGRKPKGRRAGSPHVKRPTIKPHHALHVVLRVVPAVGSMRRRSMYKAMRDASVNRPIPSGASKTDRLAADNWPVNRELTGHLQALTGHDGELQVTG